MFAPLQLFASAPCPQLGSCKRPNCLFAHENVAPLPPIIQVPSASSSLPLSSSVPSKRPAASPSRNPGLGPAAAAVEPPKKVQIVGNSTGRKPIVATSSAGASTSAGGAPTLRVLPGTSPIALRDRQAMLKTVYDQFFALYHAILPSNPSLASDHALRQEDEVCAQSTKGTYRNAMIQTAASIKKRPAPDSINHDSVGTVKEVNARAQARLSLKNYRLTPQKLAPYILPLEDYEKWGYMSAIPDGVGGSRPNSVGETIPCERCKTPFEVEENPNSTQCHHHWGRSFVRKAPGDRTKFYSCCNRTLEEAPCSQGVHVFYEQSIDALHDRHKFSFLPPRTPGRKTLDIVALDCEMVYTTGGMRIARVSVIDSMCKTVFDELVAMDEGVQILDYNTRFSGITPEAYAKATKPLAAIREALNAIMDAETILIGHALDNDLKTLRIVHHRCVDTVVLYPHTMGAPYRRALRDLSRQYLGVRIQSGGGSVGHSSVEDSIATLDLVRHFMLHNGHPPSIC